MILRDEEFVPGVHTCGPPEQTLHLLKSYTKGGIMNQWENFHILQLHNLNQLIQEKQVPVIPTQHSTVSISSHEYSTQQHPSILTGS